jgi:hypothetical protein
MKRNERTRRQANMAPCRHLRGGSETCQTAATDIHVQRKSPCISRHDNAQATPSAAGRAAAFRAGEGGDMKILLECGFMKLGTYKRFGRTCSVNLQDRGQNCRRIAGIYQFTRRHISSHRTLPATPRDFVTSLAQPHTETNSKLLFYCMFRPGWSPGTACGILITNCCTCIKNCCLSSAGIFHSITVN